MDPTKQDTEQIKHVAKFIGIREAAETLGVSYSAVWDALRRGDFPVANVQIGSKWRISRVGLEALVRGERD